MRVTKFFMLWSPLYMMGLSQPRTSRAQGLKEMKSSKRSTPGLVLPVVEVLVIRLMFGPLHKKPSLISVED